MIERSLQSSILNYLAKMNQCRAYNLHGSAWSGSGRPDIIGVYRGVPFLIELKRPGEIPTQIQEYELNKWRAAGAIAWYATSLNQVKELIKQIDERLNDRGER